MPTPGSKEAPKHADERLARRQRRRMATAFGLIATGVALVSLHFVKETPAGASSVYQSVPNTMNHHTEPAQKTISVLGIEVTYQPTPVDFIIDEYHHDREVLTEALS